MYYVSLSLVLYFFAQSTLQQLLRILYFYYMSFIFFFDFGLLILYTAYTSFFDNSFSGVVSLLISFILLFSQFFHIFSNIYNNNSISIISFDTCSCNSFVIYGLKQKLRNGILWIIYIRTVDITCK